MAAVTAYVTLRLYIAEIAWRRRRVEEGRRQRAAAEGSSPAIARRATPYSILETFEAGVVLVHRVKACGEGAGLAGRHLRHRRRRRGCGCATCTSQGITAARWTNHAPRRNRKLLLHRRQIDTLIGKIRDGNLTLVPLSLYFTDGKVEGGAGARARGKQAHDKRQDLARRDAQREVVRELGRRARGMS